MAAAAVVSGWWLRLTILIMWIPWTTALFTEDTTIKVINVSYTSQHMRKCWFHFKNDNIICDHIHLTINDTTVLNDEGYILPVMNFTKSEGFKVEGCQAVLMRCCKGDMETHYKIQVKEEGGDGNMKEEGGDGNRYWIIGVVLGILTFALICFFLGLAIYCRKVYCRHKHHLPFCCESQVKDRNEDPAVEQNLCESQETL